MRGIVLKYLLLLAILFVLVSCSTPPYKSVTTGPVAEVKFGVENIKVSGFLSSPEISFTLHKCFLKGLGGVLLTKNNPYKTVNVKAGVPLHLSISYVESKNRGVSLTNAYFSFLPEVNQKYSIIAKLNDSGFRVTSSRLDASGSPIPLEVVNGIEKWQVCPS